MVIEALIGQFSTTGNVEDNLDAMRRILAFARPDELVVLPEGALSGYDEDPAFLSGVDPAEVEARLDVLADETARRGVHLFFESCLFEGGRWYNAGLYRGPNGESFTYRKVNLATKERGVFAAGSELPVLGISVGGREVGVGIQLCRELRYPEQHRPLVYPAQQVVIQAHLTELVDEDGRV